MNSVASQPAIDDRLLKFKFLKISRDMIYQIQKTSSNYEMIRIRVGSLITTNRVSLC